MPFSFAVGPECQAMVTINVDGQIPAVNMSEVSLMAKNISLVFFFSIGFLVQGFVYQHYYGSGQKIKDEDPQRNPRDTPACMHACMHASMYDVCIYIYIYKCIPCMLYA